MTSPPTRNITKEPDAVVNDITHIIFKTGYNATASSLLHIHTYILLNYTYMHILHIIVFSVS